MFFGLGKGISAAMHPFAKLFSFFGGHVFPALSHAMLHSELPLVAVAGVTVEPAKEDSAKKEEANSLPEGDALQTEDLRQ